MSSRTAVIFGGAGFFGTHLARAMRRCGEYSRIVSIDTCESLHPVDGVEYIFGDVRQPIELANMPPEPEIYNFAAVHTTPGHEDWEYFWTNEWGAIHVSDFASAIGAKLLFFSSSISTYGSTESELDENGPFAPTSAYGRSKLLAEGIHRSWQKSAAHRRLRVVRPGVIFGQGERGNFTRLAAALRAKRFFYPGRDDAIKSCGFVGELVRSILFMRDLPDANITYNFAYPDRYTTREICSIFCRQANFKMPSVVIPSAVILAAGLAFEIFAAFGVRTSINRARIRKLMLSTNIVPRKLLELGYHFETDLAEGIKRWHLESRGRFE